MPEPRQKPGKSEQIVATDRGLIRAVEARWGRLTVDLCATPANAKAPKYITEDGEGLICLTKDGRGPNCYHLTPSGVAHLEKYEAVFRNFDRKPSERTA